MNKMTRLVFQIIVEALVLSVEIQDIMPKNVGIQSTTLVVDEAENMFLSEDLSAYIRVVASHRLINFTITPTKKINPKYAERLVRTLSIIPLPDRV